ncbi:MAG: bifunctional 3-deoxy-7-phosphoheptulonate synthase/chorismate mutase [Clostridiaceae bacterium]|nr:bifunctional 3-deoxy-7-phosphoheptulonate synthase/chorismate mutase [Clostridiaceae bacterium]
MIIVMKPDASQSHIRKVVEVLEKNHLKAHLSKGKQLTIIGVIGDKSVLSEANLEAMDGVERLVPITESYKLSNKKFKPEPSVIKVKGFSIGGGRFSIVAGPCSVESREQLLKTARFLKTQGVCFLRGGAFKPRTSPYAFQGLGQQGLEYLKEAAEETGMAIVTEVTSMKTLEIAIDYADVFQIGARNMHSFELLKEVGKAGKPVVLKRGLSATIDEWLNAAEYIMREGNNRVILCERGIRTFETATRNTLDISAIPVIRNKSHLPVLIDPSHATGVRDYIVPLCKAAMAVGADGIMVEVHPAPSEALSDGAQSLDFEDFKKMLSELKPLAELCGKVMDR